MIKIYNKLVNETVFKEVLDNGLTVYLCKKKDYKKKYAIMTVNYGSLYKTFIPYNDTKYYDSPLGVAHFLEHKLFSKEDGTDVAMDFAKLGCECNAYTSYSETSYLFSGTENLFQATTLLLNFVQKPCFTDESILREQGIIEQELLMYQENAGNVLEMRTLESMFEKNNVRYDIGGTIESIKQINKEVLDKCYNTFYHPQNMKLTIVGDFDEEELMNLIRENQSQKQFPIFKDPQTIFYSENQQVNRKEYIEEFEVNVTSSCVGMKFPNVTGINKREIFKNYLILEILLDTHFNVTTPYYQRLMKEGIINYSYGFSFYLSDKCCYLHLTCEIDEADRFINEMKNKLISIRTTDITLDEINFVKKVYTAMHLRKYNSIVSIAQMIDSYSEEEIELDEYLEILNEITLEEVLSKRELFIENAITVTKLIKKTNN